MESRFLNRDEAYHRLLREYLKYGSLYIAFDFDHTVFDYDQTGDTFEHVEALLKEAKEAGNTLILFTCREGDRLQEAIDYCTQHGYQPDYVNENPEVSPNHTKPYYNVLLDDRAGLDSAYNVLYTVLKDKEQYLS